MSYRYMRMILMFDMPTDTAEERKAYRKFRKFLLSEGFIMHQFSIYSKLLLNNTANNAMIGRLREHNPTPMKDLYFLGRLLMNLNFPLLDEPIPLRGGTILVLEDVCVFSKIVQYCYQYEEDSELKFFDHKMKTIKESEIMLVTDILGFDVNSSTILKLIHADLESQFNEKPEVKSMIDKLVATITELIVFECLENELDLEYDEITILELIKSLGVKVETQSDAIFEKCLEILQIFKYLTKKKLVIFVNSGAFLAKEEVACLQEYISLTNLTVLFLESRELYDFPQYILDEDYFLITKIWYNILNKCSNTGTFRD